MQKKLRLRFDFRLCSRMASGQNWDQSGLDTNNHSRRVIEVGWRLFLENVKKPNSKRSNRLCENQIGCAFWANMIMFHCYFYQDLWSLMLVLDCNSYSYDSDGSFKGIIFISILLEIGSVLMRFDKNTEFGHGTLNWKTTNFGQIFKWPRYP